MTTSLRNGFAFLLVLSLFAPSLTAQEVADEKTLEEKREEARIERLWKLNWRHFAPYFVEHEGEFICVPTYDRAKPSSTGQSASDYRTKSAWEQAYTDERGKETKRKLTKPEEDAFAAVALLPKVEVGQYGFVHSGFIKKIADDKTVELSEVWLVDSKAVQDEKRVLKEKLFGKFLDDIEDAIRDRGKRRGGRSSRRVAENQAIDWGFEEREAAARRQRESIYSRYTWVVKGFATSRLETDARWPSANAKGNGLQLIIVKIDDRTVTAVPAATLRNGISEMQFYNFLESRKITQAQFIDIVNEAKREHRSDYIPHVLARLTGETPPEVEEDRGAINDEVQLAD